MADPNSTKCERYCTSGARMSANTRIAAGKSAAATAMRRRALKKCVDSSRRRGCSEGSVPAPSVCVWGGGAEVRMGKCDKINGHEKTYSIFFETTIHFLLFFFANMANKISDARPRISCVCFLRRKMNDE